MLQFQVATDKRLAGVTIEVLPAVAAEHWPAVWRFVVEHDHTEFKRWQLNAAPLRELKDAS